MKSESQPGDALRPAALEVNFDGLIGPSHNYAGLAFGNRASMQSKDDVANPRAAALQGLAKLRTLHELGVAQALLPPHPRPALAFARRLGFRGSRARILEQLAEQAPRLLAAVWSSSAMWSANAATVSSSANAADGRVHITPANLSSHLHRSLEADHTSRVLERILRGPSYVHHPALPAGLGDEGAANHCSLSPDYGLPGIEVFVHGRDGDAQTSRFPARQHAEASRSVARLHALGERALHLRQSTRAIEVGAFHNDVVLASDRNFVLCHEAAFEEAGALEQMAEHYRRMTDTQLQICTVSEAELPLDDVVRSYLFNSQLVRSSHGERVLVAPIECAESRSARRAIERLLADETPIDRAVHVDLRESMRNGGGPACLRLRIVLDQQQLAALPAGVLVSDGLLEQLDDCVRRHYRDRVTPADLADPQFAADCAAALDALGELLGSGAPPDEND